MSIAIIIITNILLVYGRIWLVSRYHGAGRRMTGIVLGRSSILVAILLGYDYLVEIMHRNIANVVQLTSPYAPFIFMGYCLIAAILLLLFPHKQLMKKIIIAATGFLLAIAILLGLYMLEATIFLTFIVLSAYTEEYLKISTGRKLMIHDDQTSLIRYSLLIGIGFSFVENILYGLHTEDIMTLGTVIIGRGFISTLFHMIATGSIAYLFLFGQKKNKQLLGIIMGLIVGISIHIGFNILSYNGYVIWIIIAAIAGYMLLTFLLFQSNQLYKK